MSEVQKSYLNLAAYVAAAVDVADAAAAAAVVVVVVVDTVAAAVAIGNNAGEDSGPNILPDLVSMLDIVDAAAFGSYIVGEHSYCCMHWGCCTHRAVDGGNYMVQALDWVPVDDFDFGFVEFVGLEVFVIAAVGVAAGNIVADVAVVAAAAMDIAAADVVVAAAAVVVAAAAMDIVAADVVAAAAVMDIAAAAAGPVDFGA